MMTQNATSNTSKFLFDLDFAESNKPGDKNTKEVQTIPLLDHEAILSEEKRKARAEGVQQGIQDAQAKATQALAQETSRLAAIVQKLFQAVDKDIQDHQETSLRLALAAAQKLSQGLLTEQSLQPVETLLRECLEPLRKTPHLVIRLAEKDCEALDEKLKSLSVEKGFEGRLVILGEPDYKPGDCRIEWADGGMVLDQNAIKTQIETLVETFLNSKRMQSCNNADEGDAS
jgi:flagellar assembly protein FliH